MAAQSNIPAISLEDIQRDIKHLESRLVRLEHYLEIPYFEKGDFEEGSIRSGRKSDASESESDSLEAKIGEFWLARVGSIALLLGIVFLVSYPFEVFSPVVMSLVAYLMVAAILVASHYWQKTLPHISGLLFNGGLILLYFVTLRLYFLNDFPVLKSQTPGLASVLLVLALMFYLANRYRNEFLAGTTLLLCVATSLISETDYFALSLLTVTALASSYTLLKYAWQRTFITGMLLVYLTHLLWMLNNPFMGGSLQPIEGHQASIAFLFAYGAIFALPVVIRPQTSKKDLSELTLSVSNAFELFVLVSLTALLLMKEQVPLVNLLLACFFFAFGVAKWVRHQSSYGPAIYACFGNLGLSIAIFAQFVSPDFFVWLSWQSLLVISTAIWFRSRIITVVNTIIYMGIFLAYLQFAESSNFVNLSYALVALTSARILNWKKERLELKTDMIRNAYLASAFIIVLYGCYQAVPAAYVSISWLAATLFYFGMSLLLNNIKYRWLAFLTIFATLIRVFLIDTASLDAALRIVIFLAVGFVLLALSLYYSKRRRSAT
jgi:hypothetical protein